MKSIILSLLLLSTTALGNENPGVIFPTNVIFSSSDEYKDMQWNRYTTKNFTIMSIENNEGKWLFNNLENIKKSSLKKWGIIDKDLSVECRIMVVNNKDILKKFFNLTDSKIELRKKDGKAEIIAVWICIENHNHKDLDKIITEVCFKDMLNKLAIEKKFLERGVVNLRKPKEEIKEIIKNILPETSFLDKTEEDYKKLNQQEKQNFETNSTVFCLMLKKEFGEKKFLKLMLSKGNNIEKIIEIYGYKDKEEIEKTFKRYCEDLKKSIQKNEIEDKYLEIERLNK